VEISDAYHLMSILEKQRPLGVFIDTALLAIDYHMWVRAINSRPGLLLVLMGDELSASDVPPIPHVKYIVKPVTDISAILEGPRPHDRLIRFNEKVEIYADDIISLQANGSSTKIVTTHGVKHYGKSLRFAEEKVRPHGFVRLSHTRVVNPFHIKEGLKVGNEYVAVMSDGERIVVTQNIHMFTRLINVFRVIENRTTQQRKPTAGSEPNAIE